MSHLFYPVYLLSMAPLPKWYFLNMYLSELLRSSIIVPGRLFISLRQSRLIKSLRLLSQL